MNRPDAILPRPASAQPIDRILLPVALAVMGSLILTASAKISVPIGPVPMTLQTLAVFVIAAAYGRRLGLATLGLYLAQGAAGLPVFQGTPEKGIGLAYMMGPTGGYLAGFVAITLITGWAADRGWWKSPVRIGAAMLVGEAVTLILGAGWLMVLLGVQKGLAYGVGPFIMTDLLKLCIAAGIVPVLGHLVRRLRRN